MLARIADATRLIGHIESNMRDCGSLISDLSAQMRFQGLTGQRVRRILAFSTLEEARGLDQNGVDELLTDF